MARSLRRRSFAPAKLPTRPQGRARTRYDIYCNTPGTGRLHAADCVVEEASGTVERVAFRYRQEYLDHARAFPIDPGRLPHGAAETVLPCRGGVPAFIDDYLPDAWGRSRAGDVGVLPAR